jgi:hypothetical protein
VLQQVEVYLFKHTKQLGQLRKVQHMDGELQHGDLQLGELKDLATSVTLAPGSWSLDNYGQVLVATIKNGKTFTWDPSAIGRLSIRATVVANAPTASVCSVVSDRDRHLFLFGTETTIGDASTQDPMFIRFSNQEDINTWNPTVTNTAGTFRLDTGNEIIGAITR